MHHAHPLSAFGWNDRVDELVSGSDPALRPGRVTRVDRGRLTAVTAAGIEQLAVRDVQVTTGDWILVSPSDPPEVEAVLPRWSALERHDPGRAAVTQLMAANIDVGFAVLGLDRPPSPAKVERLLTLLWSSGAVPIVVLTKADLIEDAPHLAADVERSTVGVEVVLASSQTGEGIERLRSLVPAGTTAVLLGASGAGKSSLANALVGSQVQVTGAVRASDSRGRHTTRARELVPVPGAGVLLDTPGIRGIGLAAGQDSGLDQTFTDIVALGEDCRFRDCRHRTEPGCAVRAAVADGRLDPARLASFEALEREVASAARRADVRASRAFARTQGRLYRQVTKQPRRTDRPQ